MSRRFSLLLLFCMVGAVLRGPDTRAEDASQTSGINRSLMRLRALSNSTPSAPPAVATAFVLADGLVLTVQDVFSCPKSTSSARTSLNDVMLAAEPYPLKEKEKEFEENAAVVYASDELDLMLVKVPDEFDLHPAAMGQLSGLKIGEPLQISGFLDGTLNPVYYKGTLGAVDRHLTGHFRTFEVTPPAPPAPPCSMAGSPVYDKSGQVVGILSGDSSENKWYFVPETYLDMLLTVGRIHRLTGALNAVSGSAAGSAYLADGIGERLKEMATSLEELEALLTWTGPRQPEEGEMGKRDCRVVASYKKMLTSGPVVNQARFQFTPSIKDSVGEPVLATPVYDKPYREGFDPEHAVGPSQPRSLSGTFCLDKGLKILEDSKRKENWKAIVSVAVKVTPYVTTRVGAEPKEVQPVQLKELPPTLLEILNKE